MPECGMEAALFRSSVATFLPEPSMLKGRNQPDVAGEAFPLDGADAPVTPSTHLRLCLQKWNEYCNPLS